MTITHSISRLRIALTPLLHRSHAVGTEAPCHKGHTLEPDPILPNRVLDVSCGDLYRRRTLR